MQDIDAERQSLANTGTDAPSQGTVLADRPAASDNGPAGPRLQRQIFRTSRLLEFCSRKELTLQTGHPVEQWPLVIEKELADNTLDAAEEAGVAPVITIDVRTDSNNPSITVTDNAGGIGPETIKALLDFSSRVSSREAYVSPTRGAQGNALKTILAMPFALDGASGRTTIESRGTRHDIAFSADMVRQAPQIEHIETAAENVKTGTSITVHWPVSACSILKSAKARFLQIASNYLWLNPHPTLTVIWDGDSVAGAAIDPIWRKWLPSDPTPAHWHDVARLERLAAAIVAADQESGRQRTVREFIADFRGLSGSAKQKLVLAQSGLSRMLLAELFPDGAADRDRFGRLLAAMQDVTKPVKAADIGIIGKEAIAQRFAEIGARLETFQYKRFIRDDDGIPSVIELAFGYCPSGDDMLQRRIIAGVNWSVSLANPFRQLGGQWGSSVVIPTLVSHARLY
jgi:DNA topoisomerase VI subunit B